MLRKLLKEISDHKLIYVLLLIILGVGLFFRVYNINNLLGFYYDQGRDALVAWDFWHFVHIPFIGPTTGIAGIFRGPFYDYLITPFYWLGRGNPVWPSVFLSVTTVIASALLYYLGFKIQDRVTGLLAAAISAVSFNLVMASRWLSNPTPMLLLSVLFVWMLLLITEGKRWAWIPAVFIAFVSLFHFGSAGEVFYFPVLVILAIWKRRYLPSKRNIIFGILLVLISILPLVAFDIKNHGILFGNIKNFLVGEKSFALPTGKLITAKLSFYYEVFTSKIFNGRYLLEKSLLGAILIFFILHLRGLIKKDGVKVLLILLFSLMVGLIFFQGNFGNLYDYYLTGYYLPFVLLFAVALGRMWKYKLGIIFVVYFMYLFVANNYEVLHFKLWDKSQSVGSVNFVNQKAAINWIYQDAGNKSFNVDVYVPPVIPYAYDYLLKWLPTTSAYQAYSGKLVTGKEPLLYTLYEADGDHPERLVAWLARQKGIGKVITQYQSGAITVERRVRL